MVTNPRRSLKFVFMSIDKSTIENLRQEYKAKSLTEKEVSKNPITQFEKWFKEAMMSDLLEPNIMTLATASPDGKPSARIVLLKGFDQNGFIFYTNYLSRKGKEIAKNPYASLVFYWHELERQVRIEGTIEKLGKEESERYFQARPKDSQIGALASPQSQEIGNRKELEEKWLELEEKYHNKDVPKPSFWGGYIVRPQLIEFWQGRPGRLHDRLLFKRVDKATWKLVRLAP